MDWSKIDNTVEAFTLEGVKIPGKVVKVYDGDTVHIVFPVFGKMYKWNCRISRIDTPELRTKNEKEKKYGYMVKDILLKRILNKVVNVECGDFDKYGRLLVEINDGENISDWLISNKYAFAYDGGTKQNWEDYLDANMELLNI